MSVRNERGAVLLLVLVVVALLSALLTDWAFSTLVDLRLTETFRDSNRAYYLARGGVEVGRQLLWMDKNEYDTPTEMWGVGVPSYPVSDEATVSIAIVDEDGRFNLNRIVDNIKENPDPDMRIRLSNLMMALDIANPDDLTYALIDWIDINDATSPGGAERAWYQGQQPSMAIKNDRLDTVDELLLVKGFTPEIVRKLTPFVTVAPVDKLNLNTVSPELLLAWDTNKNLSTNDIEPLLQWRETKSITGINKTNALGGTDSSAFKVLSAYTDVKSDYYLITSVAQVNDGVRTVETLLKKSENRQLWRRVY